MSFADGIEYKFSLKVRICFFCTEFKQFCYWPAASWDCNHSFENVASVFCMDAMAAFITSSDCSMDMFHVLWNDKKEQLENILNNSSLLNTEYN